MDSKKPILCKGRTSVPSIKSGTKGTFQRTRARIFNIYRTIYSSALFPETTEYFWLKLGKPLCVHVTRDDPNTGRHKDCIKTVPAGFVLTLLNFKS